MKGKITMGVPYCLVAGVAWGAQFPIAGRALKLIDPFSFTLLRYLAVSLILAALLLIAEGTKALSFEGKAKWVWFFGTMAFAVYNFLVFLGQKTAGPSGAVLASIMMALMPIASVLVMWVYKRTTPSKFTMGCILVAFLGVSLVITKGDISALSSTSGNLIPALLILTGVFGWVMYTVGGTNFNWSPLRYTTLSCILGTASALVIVVLATIAGYLKVPDVETVAAIRWEMGYMIVISGVLAVFSWNAGNRALTPINGILFINLVPVTTFVIAVLSGYSMSKLEVTGAIITIAALASNNLYQRKLIRAKSVVLAGAPVAGCAATKSGSRIRGAIMDDAAFERGIELLSRLYGDSYHEGLDRMREIAPDFGRFIVEFVVGGIYSRPQLDVASREMVAIGALTALGYALPQLKVHINGALNAGRSREEVMEAIMQVAVHAGFPAARNGILIAAEVFKERTQREATGQSIVVPATV